MSGEAGHQYIILARCRSSGKKVLENNIKYGSQFWHPDNGCQIMSAHMATYSGPASQWGRVKGLGTEEKMGVRIISLFRFEFIVFCLIIYFACTFCTFRFFFWIRQIVDSEERVDEGKLQSDEFPNDLHGVESGF